MNRKHYWVVEQITYVLNQKPYVTCDEVTRTREEARNWARNRKTSSKRKLNNSVKFQFRVAKVVK